MRVACRWLATPKYMARNKLDGGFGVALPPVSRPPPHRTRRRSPSKIFCSVLGFGGCYKVNEL